jgi:cell division protein FtsQ
MLWSLLRKLSGGVLLIAVLLMLWLSMGRAPIQVLELEAKPRWLAEQQIKKTVEPYLQQGILHMDILEMQQSLLALPWVRGVQIERSWPGTLRLRFVAYSPVLRWQDRQFVDRDGNVFAVQSVPKAVASLPRLRAKGPGFDLVYGLYNQIQPLLLNPGWKLQHLTYDQQRGWWLGLQTGDQIILGKESVAKRFRRMMLHYNKFPALNANKRWLWDLRYRYGLVIRSLPGNVRQEAAL